MITVTSSDPFYEEQRGHSTDSSTTVSDMLSRSAADGYNKVINTDDGTVMLADTETTVRSSYRNDSIALDSWRFGMTEYDDTEEVVAYAVSDTVERRQWVPLSKNSTPGRKNDPAIFSCSGFPHYIARRG
ncbi:hypothetical protein ACFOZ7_03015 [Natribaculum luteum]|uniref:Uncharacterized protein n=1 Tax=Natribaculum luteum TaxID=1586232 RepID=A0ABD5NV93_9EURY|nr:hypothetical protein [Natribaculum luteum]